MIATADTKSIEGRSELINGKKIAKGATSTEHNSIVNDIVFAIKNHIKYTGQPYKIFSENVALFVRELCDENMLFLPDIMVVFNDESVKSDGIHKTPLFVAEITSENTREHDYHEKVEIYKKIGVEEYWIVDLQHCVSYQYLKSKDFIPRFYETIHSIKPAVFNGLNIELK